MCIGGEGKPIAGRESVSNMHCTFELRMLTDASIYALHTLALYNVAKHLGHVASRSFMTLRLQPDLQAVSASVSR